MKVLKVLIKVYQRDFKMESINNLFSVINTEDATLIYGGSEFSNWVCEMFGKLCLLMAHIFYEVPPSVPP